MASNTILVNGLSGVRSGLSRFDQAAANIAARGSRSESRPDSLAKELIEIKQAQTQVKASAAVIKTANQTVGTLLDVFA